MLFGALPLSFDPEACSIDGPRESGGIRATGRDAIKKGLKEGGWLKSPQFTAIGGATHKTGEDFQRRYSFINST